MNDTLTAEIVLRCTYALIVRGCAQKFPDWPPGARTANGTALCSVLCIATL